MGKSYKESHYSAVCSGKELRFHQQLGAILEYGTGGQGMISGYNHLQMADFCQCSLSLVVTMLLTPLRAC